MARVFDKESAAGDAPKEMHPVPERREQPLSLETANKIADALGLPKSAFKLEIIFDWQRKVFVARSESWLTDELGKIILQELLQEPAAAEGTKP